MPSTHQLGSERHEPAVGIVVGGSGLAAGLRGYAVGRTAQAVAGASVDHVEEHCSNNWISARIIDRLSPAELVKRMHSYGITNRLPAVKSIALGPREVSVKEIPSTTLRSTERMR